MKTNHILVLASIVLASSLQAELVVHESFSTAGALNGQTGGTGLSASTWSSSQNVVSSATEITNVYGTPTPVSASSNFLNFTVTNSRANIAFDAAARSTLFADGATMWFSFLYDSEAAVTGSNDRMVFGFGEDISDNNGNVNNNGEGFQVRIDRGDRLNGIMSAAGGDVSTNEGTDFIGNDVRLVVGRATWVGGTGLDTIDLWLPEANALSSVSDAAYNATTNKNGVIRSYSAAVTQTNFDILNIIKKDAGNEMMDEIRFGTSYADVVPVPEPSSFALLAGVLGLTSVMLRRRK